MATAVSDSVAEGANQNSKFFHGSITQRKRRNFIKGLWDGNGMWQEDKEVVQPY